MWVRVKSKKELLNLGYKETMVGLHKDSVSGFVPNRYLNQILRVNSVDKASSFYYTTQGPFFSHQVDTKVTNLTKILFKV